MHECVQHFTTDTYYKESSDNRLQAQFTKILFIKFNRKYTTSCIKNFSKWVRK